MPGSENSTNSGRRQEISLYTSPGTSRSSAKKAKVAAGRARLGFGLPRRKKEQKRTKLSNSKTSTQTVNVPTAGHLVLRVGVGGMMTGQLKRSLTIASRYPPKARSSSRARLSAGAAGGADSRAARRLALRRSRFALFCPFADPPFWKTSFGNVAERRTLAKSSGRRRKAFGTNDLRQSLGKASSNPSAQGFAQGRIRSDKGEAKEKESGICDKSAGPTRRIRRCRRAKEWLLERPKPTDARRRDSRAGTIECLRVPFHRRLHNFQSTTSATVAD